MFLIGKINLNFISFRKLNALTFFLGIIENPNCLELHNVSNHKIHVCKYRMNFIVWNNGLSDLAWTLAQPSSATTAPQISLPNSSSAQRQGFSSEMEERPSSNVNSTGSIRPNSASATTKKSPAQLPQQQAAASGWLGGLWNKLSLKPKNQMILPDDKNPSVSLFNWFFLFIFTIWYIKLLLQKRGEFSLRNAF